MPNGLLISLVQSEYGAVFEIGSSLLTPFYEDFVLNLAPWIQNLSNKLMIVGHTDAIGKDVPGHKNINWLLAARRAETVRQTLVFGGVLPLQIIGTSSVSDLFPLPGLARDDPLNRRVDLMLVSSKSEKIIEKQRKNTQELTQIVSDQALRSMIELAEFNQLDDYLL